MAMRKDGKDMELAIDTPARLRAIATPPQAEAPEPGESDADLLVRVAGRDRDAFELLYRKYVRSVFGLAMRRLRDGQRAGASRRPARGRARVTRPPDFDDLVGMDVERSERERLRRVHEQLLVAGPPPELSPEIELGPTLAMTLHSRGAGRMKGRVLLLAATFLVLALAFLGGYVAGNHGDGLASATIRQLAGTSVAPKALASLRIAPVD